MTSAPLASAGNGQFEQTEPTDLHQLVAARFAQSMSAVETFFAAESDRVSDACWSMARRFHRGGRLLAFGNGASATDAQHVSVEFVHPVIVGKRALPALALTNDSAPLRHRAVDRQGGIPFDYLLSVLGRPADIAMGFAVAGLDDNILAALNAARDLNMLTIGLTGPGSTNTAALDFCFSIPSTDPLVVQEAHETLYHVLWECVHIFFEHEGLLE